MKRARTLVTALLVTVTAGALLALGARATSASEMCGPGPFYWYCTCREIGCGSGPQLCAQGAGFTCYQSGISEP